MIRLVLCSRMPIVMKKTPAEFNKGCIANFHAFSQETVLEMETVTPNHSVKARNIEAIYTGSDRFTITGMVSELTSSR